MWLISPGNDEGIFVKKEINVFIGNQLRLVRERANLTQEQMGELVSMGTKNISDLECGNVGLSLTALKRICERLSISSDTLLFGVSNKGNANYIANRISSLPPEKFALVEPILLDILELQDKIKC